MKPESFLNAHSVFSRAELVSLMRVSGRTEATVDSHLTRWRSLGRVARVKPGVFVRLDGPLRPGGWLPDFVALASRMAPDAAVAYHTALELHGLAQSAFERLTYVTWTKAKPTVFLGRRFVPARPRAALAEAGRGEEWIEKADRGQVVVRATSLERTVADVLDRPELAGGTDEVWRSLQAVPALDLRSLERYVSLLGTGTLAAKVGFYLESRREDLVVPDGLLQRLRTRIPRAPVFMDRKRGGRLVATWALIVAGTIVEELEGKVRGRSPWVDGRGSLLPSKLERTVPEISRFFGIVIRMYFSDHEPPHFHAIYGEMEALVAVETLEVLRGELPRRALSLVLEWAALHRNALRDDWHLARSGASPRPIEPLD